MDHDQSSSPRRGFVTTLLMGVGLVAGYGTGFFHFFRYLVPLQSRQRKRPLFVGTLKSISVGASLKIKAPSGHEITITRASDDRDDPVKGFKALSSKCPHLGCAVHWSASEEKFICPCHMGVFDKNGIALEGPPAKEGKNLSSYEVEVDPRNGWVFVMVSAETTHGA